MKKFAFLILLALIVFKGYGQTGKEAFSIPWPEEYRWQRYDKGNGIELIPGNQTPDTWLIKGSMFKNKAVKLININLVADSTFREINKNTSKARLTIIEQSPNSVLFKIEGITSAEPLKQESKLFYIMYGYIFGYINCITVKESNLNEEFLLKWIKVFKKHIYYTY
jgi:hypothetical protein